MTRHEQDNEQAVLADEDLTRLIQSQTSVLKDMSRSLEGATIRMTTSVDELRKEVQELRDSRLRPYLTSMGLFVVITLAVTGYVYGIEKRATTAFFTVRSEISDIGTESQVNARQISVNAERALARQQHALNREASHDKLHENMEHRMRDYYEALLAIAGDCNRQTVDVHLDDDK